MIDLVVAESRNASMTFRCFGTFLRARLLLLLSWRAVLRRAVEREPSEQRADRSAPFWPEGVAVSFVFRDIALGQSLPGPQRCLTVS